MAFQPIQHLKDIDSKKSLADVEGLKDCLAFLKETVGLDGALEGIELLHVHEGGGLLKLLPKPDQSLYFNAQLEGGIFVWVFPVAESEEAASFIFWKATEGFDFEEGYNLSAETTVSLPFKEKAFWSSAWAFFSQYDGTILPLEILDLIREDFPNISEITEKVITLEKGLNLLHKWDIRENIDAFKLGSFASLFGESELFLSAKEESTGMVFTTHVTVVTESLAPNLDQFLKIKAFEFDIFESFNDQPFANTFAKISAEVVFLEQPCFLEANVPLQSNENSILSFEIFPLGILKLSKGADETESISSLVSQLGLDVAIPDVFPAVNLSLPFIKVYIQDNAIESFSTKLMLHLEDNEIDNGYEVVEGLFTLYDFSIQLDWLKGHGINFTVSGAMQTLSYDFHLSFNFPTYTIRAGLAPGVNTKKSIENLASELGLPSQVGNGLAATGTAFDISMFADIDNKRLEINLENHDEWEFAEFITLTQFNLQFEFFQDWSFTGASIFTQMVLPIGTLEGGSRKKVHIDIFAGFERVENLWTFEGSTGAGEELPVGEAIDALIGKISGDSPGKSLPTAIRTLTVSNIRLYFDSDGNADFVCETKLKVSKDKEVDFWVHLKREAGELKFAGSIFINGLQLAVAFSSNQQEKNVLGSLIFPVTIDTKDIIAALAPDMVDKIPINVAIKLTGLLIGMHMGEGDATTQKSQKEYLFRLSFEIDFDLSGFPLIGKMLKEIKFTDGQLLAANKDWKNESIQQVNDLLEFIGEGTSATPPKPIAQPEQASDTAGLAQGISLGGTFQITEAIRFPLFLNFGGSSEASTSGTSDENRDQVTQEQPGQQVEKPKITPDEEPPTKAVSKPDERSQSKVGKVISAVRIQKVGLIFEKGRLGLKITGGLALATFEFELIGLQVTVPQDVLSNPKLLIENNPAEILEFSLDGFGAKIQKGTLSIMGAFMRIEHDTYEEYAGVIQVSLAKFSLAGMGSYAEFPNNVPKEERHTSLFLFVALGFPIPIHPSLLIEGMCLGFGIHRDFIPPKMDEILTYPLVQLSITPPPPIEISELLNSIGQYFPPTADQYFVVAGIKFKAFGIVKTLAMLAVKFGREFEINLIGVSSIEFPPSLFIELGWQARFVPAAGYLFIGGQLTSRSYLLIPEVHITGGFAVAVWMGAEHHGDFVVSVGGYHPQFNVPDHYPDHIPRLGISFELSPLTIKGGVYFAVTPKCLMMGGFLEASLDQGWIEAYLKIHMDAIIYFEPFHYDIRMGVEAGVTATIGSGYLSYDLNLHLNIDVHLWGPEFSGTASIDVGPKTFELEFGEGNTPKALPLHWDEFEKKFLKTADKDGNLNPSVCTVSVTKGLLRKVKEGGIEYHVIDPKQVEVEMKSLVPLASENHPSLGITPMDVRHGGYTAQMTVRGIQNFDSDEIKDSVPSGIWGGKGLVQANIGSSDSGLVKDVMTGKKLIPKKDEETTETHEISKEGLSFNIDEFDLHDKSVKYQFKKLENTSYESPFDKFSDFTGFADIEIEPFDKEELLKSAVLCYELA